MAKFSLGKEMDITVVARLITRGDDSPLAGSEYIVRLFDKDFFDDDFLGESPVGPDGWVSIRFSPEKYDRTDPIKESSIDFYFVLLKNGKEIFRSKVMEDVDIEALEEFNIRKGEIIDLGTFLVDK